ncbi:homing endonuclease associated repeat-containing protein [Brachybacterium tyrofermentans]|uniref:Homing endonuclease associated repeat-containing protein n=1 Tax=Brachybacterium tyrofermentans TaxID=47848 RepID=A0ABW0FHV1_9MICO
MTTETFSRTGTSLIDDAPLDAAGLSEDGIRRALDLSQQGFLASEIAEMLEARLDDVDAALGALVPGGALAIRTALRRRLRGWRGEHGDDTWSEAEAAFGVPHAHVLRMVRAPRDQEAGIVELGEPGFLDTVLSGEECADARAARCAQLYAFGATLQEVGDLFGVTRERIRQILGRSTPWSSTDLNVAAKALREARRREQEAAVQAWSLTHPAAPIAASVVELGLSEDQVREKLGRLRSRHESTFATSRTPTRRTQEQIIEDLRTFYAETGKLTCQAFSDWAREQDVPGHQTAAIRFGTWNEALRAAGVAEATGAPRSAFTDDDLWAAVISAVRAPDGGTTYRAVSEWLAARPAAPSGVLIRHRLRGPHARSWVEIITTALEAVNDPSALDPTWVDAVTATRDWDTPREEITPIEHILEAVRELGPMVTTNQYRDWARANGRPTMQTLQRRSGKVWSEMLAEAGGTPNASKVKGRSRDEVGEFVDRFLDDRPEGTSSEYSAWAPDRSAPSLSTVVDRFDSWSAAIEGARSSGRKVI